MEESESNISLLVQGRTEPDGAVCDYDSETQSPVKLQEEVYNLVMNEHKPEDISTDLRSGATNELSPPLLSDAVDVENCTTSSVASCSDSGICSTPHNEEDLNGFEDIPLNVSMDLCDGVNAVNFGDSLSEKLRRMDDVSGSTFEGKKSRGKL
ncbi:Hypothetical predicted protein, partial [Paramuricea clavata]